jgi:hypothetical protein
LRRGCVTLSASAMATMAATAACFERVSFRIESVSWRRSGSETIAELAHDLRDLLLVEHPRNLQQHAPASLIGENRAR